MYGTFHFLCTPIMDDKFSNRGWIFSFKKLTKFGPFQTNVSKVQTKNEFFRFHCSKGPEQNLSFGF